MASPSPFFIATNRLNILPGIMYVGDVAAQCRLTMGGLLHREKLPAHKLRCDIPFYCCFSLLEIVAAMSIVLSWISLLL
jgi:hypothetical protein